MFLVKKIHRLIRKHFGGIKNFVIWAVSVALAIYVIDGFILPRPRHARQLTAKDADDQSSNVFVIAPDPGGDDTKVDDPAAGGKEPQEPDEDKEPDKKKEEPPHPQRRSGKGGKPNCGVEEKCPKGEYTFSMSSGYGRNVSASICFNGEYLLSAEQGNSHRGMNLLIIGEKSLDIDDIQIFDVYYTDIALMEYIKESLHDGQLVFIASQDEASYSLKEKARKTLSALGSDIITKIGFRENYLIIGKRGLPVGSALEMWKQRVSGKEFADPIEMSGCIPVPYKGVATRVKKKELSTAVESAQPAQPPPVAAANKVPAGGKPAEPPAAKPKAAASGGAALKAGEELPNCGLAKSCASNEIAVQLYTGLQNKDPPKICVGGKYVMASDLNGSGRGLNFAVVNPNTREVVRVARFDTFQTDNVALEMFLELLNEGEIVLAVAYDEAAEKLGTEARRSIEELGSSYIQFLSFRDVWAFIGQKGIKGFTPLEEFSSSDATKSSLSWPKPIDYRACVPTKLNAKATKKVLRRNVARRKFCVSHDGYGPFCSPTKVDDPIEPAALKDASAAKRAIYQIPIIVVAGMNHNALRMQLEGLLSNPGIVRNITTVFYDEKFVESKALAEVFEIQSVSIASSKYTDLLQKSIAKAFERAPNARFMIVLEEEVVTTPDFLHFMHQCLGALESDHTLSGISAWNPYGYTTTSSLAGIAYRAELFPGLGFLLRRTFYEQNMKDKMRQCCSVRSWEGWLTGKLNGTEMIFPEVSRVTRGRYDGRGSDLINELLNQPRQQIAGATQHTVLNANSLTSVAYEKYVEELVQSSLPLNAHIVECLSNSSFVFNNIDSVQGDLFSIYYESSSNNAVLLRLCSCFRLGSRALLTQHKSLLRFSLVTRPILLVGSNSPYYKEKPSDLQPFTASQLKS